MCLGTCLLYTSLLRHIYENESSQQQVLCELLHLSRPTVINLIRECSEEGLIEKSGYYESTGGRKANAIVFIPDSKISIGVELLQDSYEITAIDLYGNTICTAWYEIGFVNKDSYFRNICNSCLLYTSVTVSSLTTVPMNSLSAP